jgi:hypothetical protein
MHDGGHILRLSPTATPPAPTARCRAPKSLQPDKPRAEQCSSARCDARSASWRPKIAPENWRPVRPPSNGGLSLGDDGTRMRFPPCRTEPAVILAGLCEQGVTPNAHSLCQARCHWMETKPAVCAPPWPERRREQQDQIHLSELRAECLGQAGYGSPLHALPPGKACRQQD